MKKIITYKKFETERLIIRPTSEDDGALIYELMNTEKFIRFVGNRNIGSVEEGKKYIQDKMIPQLKKHGYSNYTLIRKSDNLKIGTCGLYDREGIDGIDIGFGLLPSFEGYGYGFEAANRIKNAAFKEFGIKEINEIFSLEVIAFISFIPNSLKEINEIFSLEVIAFISFKEFGIKEINAITSKENISSQKLLERLDLQLIGTTILPDEDEELLLYKLVATESTNT